MRTVIVTGTTGGLGSALVDELKAASRDNIICVYRNEEKFNRIIREKYGDISSYKTYAGDDYSTLTEKLDTTADELVLILNAFAIKPIKSIGTFSTDEIDEMIDGNVKSNVYIINSAVSWCKKNNVNLRLINIDSGAADYPLMGWSNYGAAKAYINLFIAVAQQENPAFKVVSLDPGVMDTDMQCEIRATDACVFDKVETFRNYKNEGVLKSPKTVAGYIVDNYVVAWNAKQLREKHR